MKIPDNTDLPQGAVYRHFVIIGNGPSGIALSHLLAGYWPYHSGEAHPLNDELNARLAYEPTRSLVEQDLSFLSQGLEGRTTNPVSLLFDSLNHPCADIGLDVPSMMVWRHHPEHIVDHVVLGRGPPGGSWQSMDGNVLTISLSKWMELPELDFRSYGGGSGPPGGKESRASVAALSKYYYDYVRLRGLDKYFRCGTIVTSVRLLDDLATSAIRDCSGIGDCEAQEAPLWVVRGIECSGDEGTPSMPFCYVTSHVVLATGNCDLPNKLNIPGENQPFVLYSLKDLEKLVIRGKMSEDSDPVLVIGAGLSAADAVIAARFHGLPVLHAFRRPAGDPAFVFQQLPENMYPEYHKVHQMMIDGGESYPGYRALPEHQILEIRPNKKVRLLGPGPNGNICYIVQVSAVIALIGSQPDLSFLPAGGKGLGVHRDMPIRIKSNPIHADPFSHECIHAPGLYALGALAGDNFVRFIQGGALAIASHIHKQSVQDKIAK